VESYIKVVLLPITAT